MKYVGAIDQGTTSTRFMIFSSDGAVVSSAQIEHRQICPKPGWVEHDADEIWRNTCRVISDALDKAGLSGSDISAIGITNQRETIVPIRRSDGRTLHNAIVWQDLRGSDYIESLKAKLGEDALKRKTGLLYSPYFSASKIRWLLDNVKAVKNAASDDDIVFCTMDSFIASRLTDGAVTVTDVTNASRYMLMDIRTLEWDSDMLSITDIKESYLPEIVSSTGIVYGYTSPKGPLGASVPVAGILGDQQAALFGQACFSPGECKCTYGTGCFMLSNIGTEPCISENGLLTTVAYRSEGEKPVYALEGSVAVAGALIQWVRDDLGLVKSAKELDEEAESVVDSGGVYIVPAFSGLFAPYWRSDARGVIVGLTRYAKRAHICRAVLEATAFQANDLKDAMERDSGVKIESLKADGGMTNSMPLMVFQADIMQIPVIRPQINETTCLGAAYAAGLSVGIWKDTESLRSYWKEQMRWLSTMDDKERENKLRYWKKAVSRTLSWVE